MSSDRLSENDFLHCISTDFSISLQRQFAVNPRQTNELSSESFSHDNFESQTSFSIFSFRPAHAMKQMVKTFIGFLCRLTHETNRHACYGTPGVWLWISGCFWHSNLLRSLAVVWSAIIISLFYLRLLFYRLPATRRWSHSSGTQIHSARFAEWFHFTITNWGY